MKTEGKEAEEQARDGEMGGHGESDVKGSSFLNCKDVKKITSRAKLIIYFPPLMPRRYRVRAENLGFLKSLCDNVPAADGPWGGLGDVWRKMGKVWN